MNKIYFDTKSKREFKKNVHNYLLSKCNSEKKQILLIKKYVRINEMLHITTPLIKDLIDIVNEYINDILILEYDIKYESYFDFGFITYIISIESKNIIMNYEKYNFKYKFHISYDMSSKNEININCRLTPGKSVDDIDEYIIKYEHMTPNILTFFNEYMNKYYNQSRYIKTYCGFSNYNLIYFCKYDDNKFIITNNFNEDA